jgi:hypothetical protein
MSEIELFLEARTRDLGGFSVGRVLPTVERRLLGPFALLDHMDSAKPAPDQTVAPAPTPLVVRPHPHINLATITYLFEGEVMHRDSLGSQQLIQPGAVNWMNAGQGIVHSERTPTSAPPARMHGLQLWVALPKAHEDSEPSFEHHPASTLPVIDDKGTKIRVLAGSAYLKTSPVGTLSPLFYVEAVLNAGATLPVPTGFAERGVYVVEGEIAVGGDRVDAMELAVFEQKTRPTLRAIRDTRLVMLGGEPPDGPRFMWWNFVSSSKERIIDATQRWRDRKFPKVPGDEVEFAPAPEGPKFASST